MKKRELARLRDAVEDVAELHNNAVYLIQTLIQTGVQAMNELRDALTRAAEEVEAARVALEAATAQDGAVAENVPVAS